jgi:hypothetical protein
MGLLPTVGWRSLIQSKTVQPTRQPLAEVISTSTAVALLVVQATVRPTHQPLARVILTSTAVALLVVTTL